MAMPPGDDIVRLATASNPAEAHLWQQVLQENGIQSQAVGDYLDAGLGDIPGFRAEVWVHRKDVDRALEILRTSKAPPQPEDTDEDTEADEMSDSV
jgi:hypothetical protein